MPDWTPTDSEELYRVPLWSSGYFRVNERGSLEARPAGPNLESGPELGIGIDLHQLLEEIQHRGIRTPILLRFDGILRARVRELNTAFDRARAEYGYTAPYRGVFPIKVNQQRHVVEALLEEGRLHGMGLEVGSKPELLAVMARLAVAGMLVICNGYKDREYVETALLCSKLGVEVVLVIEKESELGTILDVSEELGTEPCIGVRSKLSVAGAGRWMESGGDRSKFGLTARQIVRVVEALEERGMLHTLQLLHFHLGSQITHIRALKDALRESTRLYLELRAMGAPIRFFDVGGGMGVDYDGTATSAESSANYSVQEYANDVVYQLAEACREAGTDQPTIITESGRALVSHHAVLVTEVLGVSDYSTVGIPGDVEDDEHEFVRDFASICRDVNGSNFQETYHDAVQIRDEAMMLFRVGQLGLRDRARVEEFYWRTCEKILRICRALEDPPEDLQGLERDLADTYFVNCSIFQSMPDSWAIQQLFPVLPLHRLDEAPTRRAVLADITCDSDGKIDRFIEAGGPKSTLELHALRENEPYYLGFFLVGAYQEILGDMHNLFGDTNVVHVDVTEDGRPRINHVVRGDRVQEVLSYVEYFEDELIASLRQRIEAAIEGGRLTPEESARLLHRYEAGLSGYTYLNRDASPVAPAIPTPAR